MSVSDEPRLAPFPLFFLFHTHTHTHTLSLSPSRLGTGSTHIGHKLSCCLLGIVSSFTATVLIPDCARVDSSFACATYGTSGRSS